MAAMMQRHHGTIVPSTSKELITIVAAKTTGNYLSFTRKNLPLLSKEGQIPKRGSFIIEALSLLELWGRKNFDMHGRGRFLNTSTWWKIDRAHYSYVSCSYALVCVCKRGSGVLKSDTPSSFPVPVFPNFKTTGRERNSRGKSHHRAFNNRNALFSNVTVLINYASYI